MLRHLRLFRHEVRQPPNAATQGIGLAVRLLAADPAGVVGSHLVFRAVAGVVVDHVEQHPDAARVGGLHQQPELLLGAEAGLHRIEVVDPVAVEAPVLEPVAHPGLGDRVHRQADIDLALHGIDPDGGRAERRDLVELLPQTTQVAPVPAAGVEWLVVEVVGGITVGEAIDQHEIDDRIAPVALGLDHREAGSVGVVRALRAAADEHGCRKHERKSKCRSNRGARRVG
jgi:hypothetical protein